MNKTEKALINALGNARKNPNTKQRVEGVNSTSFSEPYYLKLILDKEGYEKEWQLWVSSEGKWRKEATLSADYDDHSVILALSAFIRW